jgi:hypothetical protein
MKTWQEHIEAAEEALEDAKRQVQAEQGRLYHGIADTHLHLAHFLAEMEKKTA